MTADLLGVFRSNPAVPRGAGYLAFCGSLALTVFLQRWQLELRREEAALWWASNGRDLINAVSVGVTVLALHLIGFPWPSSLFLGASVVLVLHLIEGFLDRRPYIRMPTVLTLAAAAFLAAPILIAAGRVHQGLSAMAQVLFG